MTISAILLAAGESRRMGRLKALLPWNGSNLIRFQIAQLVGAGASEVVVVLGHNASALSDMICNIPGVRPVINHDYALGKAGSLRLGVSQISAEAGTAIILAVDQPRPALLISQLISEHVAQRAMITVPVHNGQRGHPAIIDRALFDELDKVTEEGQGLREVMLRHRDEMLELNVEDPIALLDLNTPEQYEESLNLSISWAATPVILS